MLEKTEYQLSKGDRFEMTNATAVALRIVTTTSDGTIHDFSLHPGASIKIVAGTEDFRIELLPSDAPQNIRAVT